MDVLHIYGTVILRGISFEVQRIRLNFCSPLQVKCFLNLCVSFQKVQTVFGNRGKVGGGPVVQTEADWTTSLSLSKQMRERSQISCCKFFFFFSRLSSNAGAE